jgi:uncharacterized protein
MLLIPARVAPSPIHGLGLFTVEAVPARTPIWIFQPGFDQEFSLERWTALPALSREFLRHYCYFDLGKQALIRSGDHACFMNHSTTPNTGAHAADSTTVITVALKDLPPGTELTCDYTAFDGDVGWKFGQVPASAPLGTLPRVGAGPAG